MGTTMMDAPVDGVAAVLAELPPVVPVPRATEEGVAFDEVPVDQLPEKVRLMSVYRSHRIRLIPQQVSVHPITGQQVLVQKGLDVRFTNGRATVDREIMPLLARDPDFSGVGRRRVVFLEDDPAARSVRHDGPRVVNGAVSSVTDGGDASRAPLVGWDNLTPAEIADAAAKGRITDPMAALAWEFRPGGLRRERVKNILWKLDAGDDVEAPEPPVEELPEAVGEVVPTDTRRV